MLQKLSLLFLVVLSPSTLFGQLVFRQDLVQGGITAGGFSTGLGAGTGVIDLYIEPGSEIQVAYLMTFSYGYPLSSPIEVNETNYFFDESEKVTEFGHVNQFITPISVYVKEITDNISPNESQYEITIPPQDLFNGYFTVFIVIIYENQFLSSCGYSILVNAQDNTGNDIFQVSELNPIDSGFPVGLALYTDRHGLPNVSGSDVYFNDDHLGLIYGSDQTSNSWGGGRCERSFLLSRKSAFWFG